MKAGTTQTMVTFTNLINRFVTLYAHTSKEAYVLQDPYDQPSYASQQHQQTGQYLTAADPSSSSTSQRVETAPQQQHPPGSTESQASVGDPIQAPAMDIRQSSPQLGEVGPQRGRRRAKLPVSTSLFSGAP